MKRVLIGTIIGVALIPSLALARSTGDDQGLHVLFALLFLIPVFYFVPSVIAASKDHPQPGSVFFLNLCFGWTLIGWCVALFWAIEKGRPIPKPLTVKTPAAPSPVFVPELAIREIEELATLHEKALISEEDYAHRRQQILTQWTSAISPATA